MGSKWDELSKSGLRKYQLTACLPDGKRVKEGDTVMFINSDGEKCEGLIQRKANGRLFFWNSSTKISDYKNLVLVKRRY